MIATSTEYEYYQTSKKDLLDVIVEVDLVNQQKIDVHMDLDTNKNQVN